MLQCGRDVPLGFLQKLVSSFAGISVAVSADGGGNLALDGARRSNLGMWADCQAETC